ncbi:MAG: Rieske 2Fe-2S domain-containing protein [Candidatus Planktophila sp.]
MNALQSISRSSVAAWRSQSRAQRLLRVFLGITWVYAGWDKASDPGFLKAGAPTYIGTQLAAFAQSSPIGFLLNHTIEHAALVGAFVMISEFAIGFATLLSVAPASAAFGGFAMSTGLWLSSSFHTTPYFFASDSAYAVMWLSYLLLMIGNRRMPSMNIERRGILRTGIVGAIAVAASFAGRAFPKAGAATKSSKSSKSSGKKIIKVAALKVGSTHNFIHSTQGVPSVLFRTKTGVFAYSAICTHQGCTVAYQKSSKQLVCPCHGATYDPAQGAKPTSGPTNIPLAKVKVAISGAWVVEA